MVSTRSQCEAASGITSVALLLTWSKTSLDVSALLKEGRHGGEARIWLQHMTWMHALLSASMSIMHPDMYAKGRTAMIKLWNNACASGHTEMLDVLRIWPSIYGSLSLMVNRKSPYHQDKNGKLESFDQLLTVGEYSQLHLSFPTLRLHFAYPPGTVMAFSGKMLAHSVPHVQSDENRACVAWYMQHRVHRETQVSPCNFAHTQDL